MSARALAWVLVGLSVAGALPAQARVERFAVLVGNNRGEADEAVLRYAEADAVKLHDVLTRYGGFSPANVVLLQGTTADQARTSLIELNERVRARSAEGVQPLLIVFYSGHADAEALHLGSSRLPLREVEALVRGSAADVRLLIVDSCRSGALTQKKGGRPTEPFAIDVEDRLAGEGFVVLTSAAAGEDAHESDDIRGSFFTHHLVSGLRGAADANSDGRVVLEEAYRYAYANTLRSSSRALAGAQHPTFKYDLRGQGEVVLTRVEAQEEQGLLRLPEGVSFLLFDDDGEGPVVAEVGAHVASRVIVLRPGTYHVVGRAPQALYEGEVEVDGGRTLELDVGRLDRTAYDRLVRKGGSGRLVAPGVEGAWLVRGPLFAGEWPCMGPQASLTLDFRFFYVAPTAGLCLNGYRNDALTALVAETDVALAMGYRWDLPWVTLALSAAPGAVVFGQLFFTENAAPPRVTPSFFGEIAGSVEVALPWGFFMGGRLGGRVYVLQAQDTIEIVAYFIGPTETDNQHAPYLAAPLALVGALTFGKRF